MCSCCWNPFSETIWISRPSRIQETPRPTTTDQWNPFQGSRSSLAGTRLRTDSTGRVSVAVTPTPFLARLRRRDVDRKRRRAVRETDQKNGRNVQRTSRRGRGGSGGDEGLEADRQGGRRPLGEHVDVVDAEARGGHEVEVAAEVAVAHVGGRVRAGQLVPGRAQVT